MTSEESPISWITSGKLDAVLDIKFPRDADADSLNVLIDALATTAVAVVTERIPVSESLPSHLYPYLKNITKMKDIDKTRLGSTSICDSGT